NITLLRQKYPERVPCYVALNGGSQEITVEQQIYIEGEKEKEDPIIEVLLSGSVPGLGAKGNLVKIHRNRFWNNLYLRKLAELPTPERIRELQSEDSSVLFGHSYEVQQRLLNMTLYIPMNPNTDWTLSPKHVMVAFRRVGVVVPEENITLPDKPVTSSTLEEFSINVNIENKVTPVLREFCRFSSNAAKARIQTLYCFQREKGWSKRCRKITLSPANQTALKHFDRYYTHICGATAWCGIRAALLTPPAKVAILNAVNPGLQQCLDEFYSKNYLDLFTELTKPIAGAQTSQKTQPTPPQKHKYEPDSLFPNRQFLIREDAISDQLSEFVPATEFIGERVIYTRDSDKGYVLQSDLDFMMSGTIDFTVLKEDNNWIESFKKLKCLVLPTGTFSELPRPKYDGNCYDFYPLDLGSVLAVLLLDVQPEARMLDLCSAPGGKAVVSLQTLNLSKFVIIFQPK
ncbi:unnamed protein product, partial [Rodentolepis nana]|uniref:Large ribosomal subunit protein bL9m n=1 Tax=Rodentolepis nana TaxID=102285 RepID=A0A0R3T5Q3_RODNA